MRVAKAAVEAFGKSEMKARFSATGRRIEQPPVAIVEKRRGTTGIPAIEPKRRLPAAREIGGAVQGQRP